MIKQRKFNRLTAIFESTPYKVIYPKGALGKVKPENSDRVVTRNMLHFVRIPKNVFPISTSDMI